MRDTHSWLVLRKMMLLLMVTCCFEYTPLVEAMEKSEEKSHVDLVRQF